MTQPPCRFGCRDVRDSGWMEVPQGAFQDQAEKLRSNLGLSHVQEAHGVAVAVQECPDCVERLVELPLDVSQFLKDLAGRP